jgi:hypothetical protein
MQSGGELMYRSMVWGLRLLDMGDDSLLHRPFVTHVLVGSASASVHQQLAPAECRCTVALVPLTVACGQHSFTLCSVFPWFLELTRYSQTDI